MLDTLMIPFSLEEMKKMREEVRHIGSGEFLLLCEKQYGENFTTMAAQVGIDDFVKRRLIEILNARIEELEGNNGKNLSSLS